MNTAKHLIFIVVSLLLLHPGYLGAAPNLKVGIFLPEFPPLTNLTNLEQTLGGTFDAISWYQNWGVKTATSNKLKYVCKAQKTPIITWEPWGGRGTITTYPLDQIAAGKFDSIISTQLADMYKQATENGCQEIWVRFAHEMNTPVGVVYWYPWQGNPTTYIAAWKHVVDLGRAFPNFYKWVWSPAWGNSDANLYYPGADYVDYVGTTINQYWNPSNKSEWRTWQEYYTADAPVLELFGKPIVIGETATGEGPLAGSKADWVSSMFESAKKNTLIVAVVWFDNYASRQYPDVNFRLDSSTQSLEAFKAFLSHR
ncbi:hypothetical protein BH10PAT1_BH10PAT1_2230 [soil metagenome]